MATFIKLEDSPMFRKQVCSFETTTNELKDRCQRLQKGCRKYMSCLEEAYDGDIAFADCLEEFGGGQDDPVSVSIGGPVISNFITAFRELGTYKELLRTQKIDVNAKVLLLCEIRCLVEHMLSDRLAQFIATDLQDAKESRRRFDKATHVYDQARERFMSLKKGTKADIVAELEEDLQNSKSAFERCRFNLVNALMNIEAKKKYEFLESFSAIMDAHLRYFKQGYELLSQMEPFIHQVLTYAQQSKEAASIEQDKLAKRIQEFRTQVELESLRASSNVEASTTDDGRSVRRNSYKNIEALMQSTANGEVQTIKQGYLLKWSSSLRGDWKRRFFVLNSHGTLYYYRDKETKAMGSQSHQLAGTSEHGSGMFGRFRARQTRASSPRKENLGCRTVDLRVSTIKIDAEHTDLRLCFRVISPSKTYTLQAENEADRMDWIDKIRGVISSLLNSPFLDQLLPGREDVNINNASCGAVESSLGDRSLLSEDDTVKGQDNALRILREIPGNDLCAECSAPEPDWASLNLGILLCIECSGVHRNLGVHISKVRSIIFDVKVWEPTVLELFHNLGNAYCNSVWEEKLQLHGERDDGLDSLLLITKPRSMDSILKKEKYIQAKYVEKLLINKETSGPEIPSEATRIWEAVQSKDLQAVYRLIVASGVNVNTKYDEVDGSDPYHLPTTQDSQNGCLIVGRNQYDPSLCQKINESSDPTSCLQGCSLLHLACHVGDLVMLELLLQFGADINMSDFHGRTPLHHCISIGNNLFAKHLLRRGARSSIKDGGGLTSLERAMEMGAITDERLFILLTESE